MRKAYWHNFQVLTKRSEKLYINNKKLTWTKNIWMGVSVENEDYLYRIDHLKQTNAYIKFISFEPLLGPIKNIDLSGINWVIVGGESGPRSRTIEKDWILSIRDNCLKQSVPFFFKQWGGTNKKKSGRMLEGKLWNQYPLGNTT
jgi:protein gp37